MAFARLPPGKLELFPPCALCYGALFFKRGEYAAEAYPGRSILAGRCIKQGEFCACGKVACRICRDPAYNSRRHNRAQGCGECKRLDSKLTEVFYCFCRRAGLNTCQYQNTARCGACRKRRGSAVFKVGDHHYVGVCLEHCAQSCSGVHAGGRVYLYLHHARQTVLYSIFHSGYNARRRVKQIKECIKQCGYTGTLRTRNHHQTRPPYYDPMYIFECASMEAERLLRKATVPLGLARQAQGNTLACLAVVQAICPRSCKHMHRVPLACPELCRGAAFHLKFKSAILHCAQSGLATLTLRRSGLATLTLRRSGLATLTLRRSGQEFCEQFKFVGKGLADVRGQFHRIFKRVADAVAHQGTGSFKVDVYSVRAGKECVVQKRLDCIAAAPEDSCKFFLQ